MPRYNKIISRLFVESKNDYSRFLNLDEDLGLKESELLVQMKESYANLIMENKEPLEKLSLLEEIIIQIRCKEVINSELRLSLSRNYIYARSIFYRNGKEINDIRVIVGTTEEYGDELDELVKDTNFRYLCKEKLIQAMDKEIEANINKIKVYANE